MTVYSRGTASYRAPELLVEAAAFTNKVDIWALGCVLYELVIGKVAFHEDWAVRQYSFTTADLPIVIPAFPQFLQHHVSRSILHLLSRKWDNRPNISKVCQMFRCYCKFLNISILQKLIDVQSYPSYEEWTGVLADCSDEEEFLYHLANLYEKKGEQDVAIAMRQELVEKEAARRFENMNDMALTFQECLAIVYMEKGDYDAAARTYERAIEEDSTKVLLWHNDTGRAYERAIEEKSTKFWLWHNLCRAHIAWNGLDSALAVCRQKAAKFSTNVPLGMTLCNLYAAKGDYRAAIKTYMELSDSQKDPSSWYNLLVQVRGRSTPSSAADETTSELSSR